MSGRSPTNHAHAFRSRPPGLARGGKATIGMIAALAGALLVIVGVLAATWLSRIDTNRSAKALTNASSEDRAAPEPASQAIDSRISQGNTEVRLTVSTSTLTVADRLNLTLTLTSPSVSAPMWPPELEQLAGFVIVDQRDEGPIAIPRADVRNNTLFAFTRTMTLEPFLPGDREIPPLSFSVAAALEVTGIEPSGTSLATPAHTLVTRPVPIKVQGIVPDADKMTNPQELAKALSGPRMPLDVPMAKDRSTPRAAVFIAVGAGVIPALGVVGWLVARRPRPTPARDALESLRSTLARVQSRGGATALAGESALIETLDSIRRDLREILTGQQSSPTSMNAGTELLDLARSIEHLSLDQRGWLSESLGLLETARFAGDPSIRQSSIALAFPLLERFADSLSKDQTSAPLTAARPPLPLVHATPGEVHRP